MYRVALIALLIASPALADDDACFEQGGQGIAPCATPEHRVALETSLIDWTRQGHGGERDDNVAVATSLARIGLGGLTEARIGWTPLILDRPRGGPTARGIGDLTLGGKHQFGKDSSLALALELTLPTATGGVGQGTWSMQATLPGQFKLNKSTNLDLTGEVDAAANAERAGRHFSGSFVAGIDTALSEALTATVDLKVLRDDDPASKTTQETASVALTGKLGKSAQFVVSGIAGLNHDAPTAEIYAGFGILF